MDGAVVDVDVDVAVVGAGLSGLVVANSLNADGGGISSESCSEDGVGQSECGKTWRLLEAHPSRLGGRIRNSEDGIDLGPAWVWPNFQPKIAGLLAALNIATFVQPDDRGGQTYRIEGGVGVLVDKLEEQLPKQNIVKGFAVKSCEREAGEDGTATILLTTEDNQTVRAKRVVFAAPPRVISKRIDFIPPLKQSRQLAMNRSETWMAGVTKVVLRYASNFWLKSDLPSNSGLAGGPAFQVYDSGPEQGGPAALTFFTLAIGSGNKNDKTLASNCASQLSKLWQMVANNAPTPNSFTGFTVQRWPLETYISDNENPRRINPHPSPVNELAQTDWDGCLLFAGTESDQSEPGVMEGAVGAAHRVVKQLQTKY